MLFPFFNASKLFYSKFFHIVRHMFKHSLEHFFNFRFTKNRKIHFILSFQDIINAGNQMFHTFFLCYQHFSLHLQDLVPFKSRILQNSFDFFQRNVKLTEKQNLL